LCLLNVKDLKELRDNLQSAVTSEDWKLVSTVLARWSDTADTLRDRALIAAIKGKDMPDLEKSAYRGDMAGIYGDKN